MRASQPPAGTLDAVPIHQLLGRAAVGRSSGTLDFRAPDGRSATLVFHDGACRKVRTTLSPAHANVREQLEALLSLPGATRWQFREGVDGLGARDQDDAAGVDLRPLAWRALHENPPYEHVVVTLAGVAKDRFVLPAGTDLAAYGFSKDEAATLDCLRIKPMTLAELSRVRILDGRSTELLLYFLLTLGLVEQRTPTVAPVVVDAVPPSGPPPASTRTAPPASTRTAPPVSTRTVPPVSTRTAPPVSTQAPPLASPLPPPPESVRSMRNTPPPGTRRSGIEDRRTPSFQRMQAAAGAAFADAFVAFRRGDLPRADELIHDALREKPDDPEVQSLAIWIEAHKPENNTPEKTQALISKLNRILVMNSESVTAHYYRGELNKRAGNTAAALRDFQHVVELNPNHVEAIREIRLHNMRSRGSGLFGAVLGKRKP